MEWKICDTHTGGENLLIRRLHRLTQIFKKDLNNSFSLCNLRNLWIDSDLYGKR